MGEVKRKKIVDIYNSYSYQSKGEIYNDYYSSYTVHISITCHVVINGI